MTRLSAIFEGKEAKRVRVEAEIAERSERFRASPTVTIGAVTVINPTYEGPNPFEIPELLDPENAGVLLTPVQIQADAEPVAQRSKKRRDRAKSETHRKRPRVFQGERLADVDAVRNSRHSAPPPLATVYSEMGYVSDDDPFRKDPLSSSTARPNSFFSDMQQEKRKARRRTAASSMDYLQVEIPDNRIM